jgi:hypothetical protein
MSTIFDGDISTTPKQDGAKKVSYPLSALGGYDAQLIERNMVGVATYSSVVSARYVWTSGTRSVTTPTTDPDNTAAFLVEESQPDEGSLAIGLARFRRIYATVPSPVILPSTYVVSRPQIPGNGSFPRQYSDYIIDQPDSTVEAFDIYEKNTVLGDTGVPSFYPTAGSYSLVFAGYTSSTLAFSATALQVEAALDALASVVSRGGCAVSGTYNSAGGFAFTGASYATGTADMSGVTKSTDSVLSNTFSSSNNGYSQALSAICSRSSTSAPSATVATAGLTTSSGTVRATIINNSYGTHYYYGNLYYTRIILDVAISGQGITGGSYTISLTGSGGSGTTPPIAYNATLAEITAALNAIGIGGGNVFLAVEVGSAAYQGRGGYFLFSTPSGYMIAMDVIYDTRLIGGSYTVSLFSETTATIAYNAATSAISSAVNALTSVVDRGGATIGGLGLNTSDTRIDFTVNFSNPQITGVSQLSPNTSINVASTNSGRTQAVMFLSDSALRTLYAAGHSAAANSSVFVYSSPTYFAGITNYTVIDENTIQLAPRASDTWASVTTITQAGGLMKENYTPGAKRTRCTKTTTYYLPGYTANITTAADIPVPTDQSSDADLLAGIFAASKSINIDVSELEPYHFPIMQQTVVTVAASDL